MNLLRIAPLLLLAGCSWFGGNDAGPPAETRPEYLACRRAAQDDPTVRAFGARGGVDNNIGNIDRVTSARQAAEQRAYRACLRQRGLTLPGGVESIRTRD